MAIRDEIVGVLQETAKLKFDLFKFVNKALEEINRANLESEKIPNCDDSINGVQVRLAGFCTLANQVTQGTSNSALISYDSLRLFKESILALNFAQSTILTNLFNIEQQGGVGSIDENYVLSNKANNVTYPLGQGLINLNNSIDRGLDRYYLISPSITRPDATALSRFTRELEPILDELKQAKANAKRDATHIGKTASEIDKIFETANQTARQILELFENTAKQKKEAEDAFGAIATILTQANEKLPPIQQIFERSEELKNKIDHQHDVLSKFDNEMESRVNSSLEGKSSLDTLIKDFNTSKDNFEEYVGAKQQEVDNLISRAEEMLGLSTSAGLGDTFKNQAGKRGLAIFWTYLLIGASLLCIASMAIWAAQGKVNELSFLIKYAAIIPLGILVSIATVTLRKLEQSKEYYEHKASVSQAVEGYRKLFESTGNENNDKADLIKQTVVEVLKNPADSLSKTTNDDSILIKQLDKLTDICKKWLEK